MRDYTPEERAAIREKREAPWQDPFDGWWEGVYVVRLRGPLAHIDHAVPYVEGGEPIRRYRATETACGRADPGEAFAAPECGVACGRCHTGIAAAFTRLRDRIKQDPTIPQRVRKSLWP